MGAHALRKHPGVGLLAWAAEALNTRLFSQIIAVSPGTRSQVKARVGSNVGITTIYNGVDTSCFVPDVREEDYILFFGRLDIYNKGIDLLLKAFARIRTDHPNLRLILAGRSTPERRREVETLSAALNITDRVDVTGPVSDERKRNLFGGALFTCLPSRYEGWGITAIEASAAGKAVIGTDISGLADAIRKDETGLLVPPENVDALAGAMRRLLRDPETRRRFGQAGREWARRFTWDRIALQQERTYERTVCKLSEKRGRGWD
jgi:glycosyltransferase involved in cell wall biosynthesis